MLDDLDWELERRGHRFVRYADDVRVYVASERAGQRVMASITRYVERRLKLKVSRQKSAVDLAKNRRLLGFRFFGREREVKVRIDPKRPETGQGSSASADLAQAGRLDGAADQGDQPLHGRLDGYYALADTPSVFEGLDQWLRTTIAAGSVEGMEAPQNQAAQADRAGNPRARGPPSGPTRARATGASQAPQSSPARCPTPTGTNQGLKGFADPYRRFRDAERTAGCGPARPVVWGAPG